jgi:hypothetical protein
MSDSQHYGTGTIAAQNSCPNDFPNDCRYVEHIAQVGSTAHARCTLILSALLAWLY